MSGRRFNRAAMVSMRPRWVRAALQQANALAKLVRDKAAESLTDAEIAIARLYAKANTVRVYWGWGGGGRLPHQGRRECARRIRQRDRDMRNLEARAAAEGFGLVSP